MERSSKEEGIPKQNHNEAPEKATSHTEIKNCKLFIVEDKNPVLLLSVIVTDVKFSGTIHQKDVNWNF